MSDYQWTVASATWQIQHGGPTHKTLSAIDWLYDKLDLMPAQVAAHLLAALVETQGLQHLGDALEPLPDETEVVSA